VEYEVVMIDGETVPVDSPAELPDESQGVEIREPWMTIEIITPTDYYGPSWIWSPSAAASSSSRNIRPRTACSWILKFRFPRSSWISSTI
jgi:translation elongation factor EF-4